MKRLIALFLIFLIIVPFTACSKNGEYRIEYKVTSYTDGQKTSQTEFVMARKEGAMSIVSGVQEYLLVPFNGSYQIYGRHNSKGDFTPVFEHSYSFGAAEEFFLSQCSLFTMLPESARDTGRTKLIKGRRCHESVVSSVYISSNITATYYYNDDYGVILKKQVKSSEEAATFTEYECKSFKTMFFSIPKI